YSRAHGGRLEAARLRDGPGREVAAVAVAQDAELVLVGHTQGDDVIDAGHQVAVVAAAPIFVVGLEELHAVAAAAARVRAQHRETTLREGCHGELGRPGQEVLRIHAR